MPEFSPGDVVKLKSGSPPMTVDSYKWDARAGEYKKDKLICKWFGDDQELKSATFPESTLETSGSGDSDKR